MNFPFEKILNETPRDVIQLSGGNINTVFEFKTSKGEFVIKINHQDNYPNMLALEATGIAELMSPPTVNVPKISECGTIDGYQFLIMEKIWTLDPENSTWQIFGEQLAKLHQRSQAEFGWQFDNYIGSLNQMNTQKNNWIDFLIECRLQPMLEMAVNQGDVNYIEAKKFEPLYQKLPDLIPQEKPSLLHGDLWSGNFLTGPSLEPVLIDPAVYYGHREIDIAMMHLFGGFSPLVVNTYNEFYPLEKNWKDRLPINQLYPLLVHVNLFGRSYWSRIQTILDSVI